MTAQLQMSATCCARVNRQTWGGLGVGFALAAYLMAGANSILAEPGRVSAGASRVLQVGASRELHAPSAAAAVARDGDTIEIDAGEYPGDVAVWTHDRLTIRAVGGRARLSAAGASAEGKAIWVVRGGAIVVENIDFIGARVPDRNGAGIRFERGKLTLRNCLFEDNENGILTSGDAAAELEIEGSEFGNNGSGDGFSHNLYVGTIRKLTVVGSYFHHARVGHLIKSRAAENHILYNRLTDEAGGSASYELEFPSGGLAYVVGNLIAQGAGTNNPAIVSFGAEGFAWPRNELHLINNTLIDGLPSGGSGSTFLAVKPGNVKVTAINNLLVGRGTLDATGSGKYFNNFTADPAEFVDAVRHDYRLAPASRLIGKGVGPGEANGIDLTPRREYVHPRQTRALRGGALHPGAAQRTGPAH